MSTLEEKVFLEIKTPKSGEETPEAMTQVFASTLAGKHTPFWKKIFTKTKSLSFELICINQTIHFCIVAPKSLESFLMSQLSSQYPKIIITKIPDFLEEVLQSPHISFGSLELSNSYYYPIKTYKSFDKLDPLSNVLGTLSKLLLKEGAIIQINISPPSFNWQSAVYKMIQRGIPDPTAEAPTRTKPYPNATLMEEKASQSGYKTSIRLLSGAESLSQSQTIIGNIAGSFGAFSLGEGNKLSFKKPGLLNKKTLLNKIIKREEGAAPPRQILNIAELATLWHPPGILLTGIRNINWGGSLIGEAPQNLPVATNLTDDDKKEINFFAKTEYKNQLVTFGIKRNDRRKHVYIIGKTGTGKSTLIANKAINDMRNGEGIAVIDPHGDLSEILLDYIPSHRINDVVYLEPFNTENPFWLNALEVKNPIHKELVASGIVAIFYKLYSYSWGPRLEYILRNTIMTLLEYPGSTLAMVPDLLSTPSFRNRVLAKVTDTVLINFWKNEYDQMPDKLRSEAIAPIQNKVGQFVTSPTIRQIISHPTSTIDLEDIMNNQKILILNLSQGKLGEDNAALLGAMLITKLQLAAMSRVNIPEEHRKDFYLYVDEFQNFATSSFIKILSEARKYRLNLIIANQYIGQVEEGVQKAIFGNAGTLVSFIVGAQDASLLTREFGGIYKEEELVNLGTYQIVSKLSIDNLTSAPFHAVTLPLPKSINQNREKVLKQSLERYTKKSTPQSVIDAK